MLGIECNKCNKKFTSEYINLITGVCVYCENNTNVFYYNGDLMTKQEAIERNEMYENLVKIEKRNE